MHFWQLSEKRISRLFGIRHLHISRKTPCLPPSHREKKCISIVLKRLYNTPGNLETTVEQNFGMKTRCIMEDVQIANDGNLRTQGGVWTIDVPAIM